MFHDWNALWRASLASIFTFYTVHQLCAKFIPRKDERQHWRQVNIATSFIHSVISSVVNLYCFVENPKMCTTDVIGSFTPLAYSFVSFELGYFIFDTIDMFRHATGRHKFEIVLHHSTIIVCFGISLYRGAYIGYCVLSLFIEMNSVFLHLRQLFLFWNKSKQDRLFRLIMLINLVTFVVFRFGMMLYMSVWLYLNRSRVPLVLCFVGQGGLLLMTIMNFHLFYRLIKSDYSSKRD